MVKLINKVRVTRFIRKSKKDRQKQWPKEKRRTGQTMICKTLHRKQKIEQHETGKHLEYYAM
jgi:hypothetical protein